MTKKVHGFITISLIVMIAIVMSAITLQMVNELIEGFKQEIKQEIRNDYLE